MERTDVHRLALHLDETDGVPDVREARRGIRRVWRRAVRHPSEEHRGRAARARPRPVAAEVSEMKRTCWWIAAVLFVALGLMHSALAQTAPPAAPASSGASPAELWATMLKSQGPAYVAARDKLLQSGAASGILGAKLTDSDWRVQAVARAGLERLSWPQAYAEYDAGLAGGLRRIYTFRAHPLRGVVMLFGDRPRSASLPPPRESRYSAAAVPFLLETLAKGAAPPAEERWWGPEGQTPEQELYSRVAQCYAALVLSSLADPRGIAPLLDVVRTGEFSYLRRYAAMGLGWTGRLDVIAPLRKALWDADPEVRKGAACGLGQLLTAPDDPELVWLAGNDPDSGVRSAAVAALRHIRSWLRIMEQGGRKAPYP